MPKTTTKWCDPLAPLARQRRRQQQRDDRRPRIILPGSILKDGAHKETIPPLAQLPLMLPVLLPRRGVIDRAAVVIGVERRLPHLLVPWTKVDPCGRLLRVDLPSYFLPMLTRYVTTTSMLDLRDCECQMITLAGTWQLLPLEALGCPSPGSMTSTTDTAIEVFLFGSAATIST